MKITVLGGGTMGEAVVKSVLRKKLAGQEDIVVSDVAKPRRDVLNSRYKVKVTEDNLAAVKGADVIVLAIKPQDFPLMFAQLAGRLKSQLVISIAAGISLEAICSKLNYFKVVRAMPNAPAQVGKGMTAWTSAKGLSGKDRGVAASVLAAMGEEQYFADEKYIDMATAISGSGPAYVYLFIEAMIDAGVHIGLPRNVATKLVIETVAGSADAIQKLEKHPAEMKNMVTSPGGTTAEALLQLESGGLRSLVINAVIAAYNKAKALGAK
ncbi:MAG: pyrroline-5-carboxylate reductase [Dehalococcoidia bacterium]